MSARARLRRRGGLALARGDSQPIASGEPVIEHVALPLTNDALTLGESEALTRPVLDQIGIGSLAHVVVDRLSLSDRIRVHLARAVVREPRLLLFDEPAVLPGPRDGNELQLLLRSLVAGFSHCRRHRLRRHDRAGRGGPVLHAERRRLRSTDSRRRVIPFPGGRSDRQQRAFP